MTGRHRKKAPRAQRETIDQSVFGLAARGVIHGARMTEKAGAKLFGERAGRLDSNRHPEAHSRGDDRAAKCYSPAICRSCGGGRTDGCRRGPRPRRTPTSVQVTLVRSSTSRGFEPRNEVQFIAYVRARCDVMRNEISGRPEVSGNRRDIPDRVRSARRRDRACVVERSETAGGAHGGTAGGGVMRIERASPTISPEASASRPPTRRA